MIPPRFFEADGILGYLGTSSSILSSMTDPTTAVVVATKGNACLVVVNGVPWSWPAWAMGQEDEQEIEPQGEMHRKSHIRGALSTLSWVLPHGCDESLNERRAKGRLVQSSIAVPSSSLQGAKQTCKARYPCSSSSPTSPIPISLFCTLTGRGQEKSLKVQAVCKQAACPELSCPRDCCWDPWSSRAM